MTDPAHFVLLSFPNQVASPVKHIFTYTWSKCRQHPLQTSRWYSQNMRWILFGKQCEQTHHTNQQLFQWLQATTFRVDDKAPQPLLLLQLKAFLVLKPSTGKMRIRLRVTYCKLHVHSLWWLQSHHKLIPSLLLACKQNIILYKLNAPWNHKLVSQHPMQWILAQNTDLHCIACPSLFQQQ